MDKKARINARKVVLAYFYSRLTTQNLEKIIDKIKFEEEKKSFKFFSID
jgi:hypothetical protein